MVHPSVFCTAYPTQCWRGMWSLSQGTWSTMQGTPWRIRRYYCTHSQHTTDHFHHAKHPKRKSKKHSMQSPCTQDEGKIKPTSEVHHHVPTTKSPYPPCICSTLPLPQAFPPQSTSSPTGISKFILCLLRGWYKVPPPCALNLRGRLQAPCDPV